MASPPFNINEAVPGDSDIVSQFPALERTFRDVVEDWITTEHDTMGRHKIPNLTTTQRNALSTVGLGTLVYNTTVGVLQICTNATGPVWSNVALLEVATDTTPSLGGPLDGDGFDINDTGVLFQREQSDAEADVSNQGQWWTKSGAPNTPMFTNDAGTDFQLASLAGTETFTNKSLTSPTITSPTLTGGTINNTPIGGSTPSSGAFTTGSFSSTLAVTGMLTASTGVEVSHATDNTLTGSGGDLFVQSNRLFRVGGTDVPIADGGTGQSTASAAFGALKQDATTSASGVVELATQTEMEAGTATDRVPSVSVVHNHPGVAKAWGYVTYSGGTPSLQTDYGVASVADGGEGVLNITLTTAMSSTNYAVVASWAKTVSEDITIGYVSINSTTSISITFRNATSVADPGSVHFAVYGDQ